MGKRNQWKKVLSSLLVLVLTLSMVAGTSGVAKAENEGATTVYKIFAIMPDNGDASNFEIADEQPEGKNLFGLLINGGTYTLSDEQEWLHIYANNASVNINEKNVADVALSGDSSINMGAVVRLAIFQHLM